MVFPLSNTFGSREGSNHLPEAETLGKMVRESGMTLSSLVQNIAHYVFGHGEDYRDLTVFDDEVREKCDLGGGAANGDALAKERMKELNVFFPTIRYGWLRSLSLKEVGTSVEMLTVQPPVPGWFLQFMQKDAPRHLAALRRKQRANERGQD